MATITVPAATRAIAVQPGQPLSLTADEVTDWWSRNLTTGGDTGPWTQINPDGVDVQALVWETPTSVTHRWTFDRLQLAVNTGSAPSTAFTGGLHLNLCEGPPATLFVNAQLGNEATTEPSLRPWQGEDDDPPLGAPRSRPQLCGDGSEAKAPRARSCLDGRWMSSWLSPMWRVGVEQICRYVVRPHEARVRSRASDEDRRLRRERSLLRRRVDVPVYRRASGG